MKDVKVIAGEECIQQHKLLECVLDVKESHRKCREKPSKQMQSVEVERCECTESIFR